MPRPSLTLAAVLVLAAATAAASGPAPETRAPRWSHDFGAQLWSPLTTADGVLYLGCDDGRAYAFDPARRAVVWSFATGGPVRSRVVPAGDLALFASDDGVLYAVDRGDGTERWRRRLDEESPARVLPSLSPPYDYDYRQSSPAVAGDLVVVGDRAGRLQAVDLATGEPRWSFATGGRIRATPTVEGGTVYVGSWDGNLYAVDLETGAERWRFATGGVVQGAAAAGGGLVVVGSRGTRVQAVDAASGAPVWEYVHEDGSWVESGPVIDGGQVLVGSSDALKLSCFGLADGRIAWERKLGGWAWGRPVVDGGAVFIGTIGAAPYYFEGVTLEPGFHAVDRATGARLWTFVPERVEGFVNGGVYAAPAVIGGTVYVAALDGSLYALPR